MANYKPFLIQKITEGSPIRDSKEWGIWIKSIPFKPFADLKDIPSHDWHDQHGDDEYIPDYPFYKAYEIDCEFVYMGVHGTAKEYILNFLKYLAENGEFTIYDTYTKIGRTDVRYVSYDPDIFHSSDGHDDIVVFKVKLKVNSPNIDIIYTGEDLIDGGDLVFILGTEQDKAITTQSGKFIRIEI